ncbi:hypothetical protein D3C80_1042690 [compost metagenome]
MPPFLERLRPDVDPASGVSDVVRHPETLEPEVQRACCSKAQHGHQAGDCGHRPSCHSADRGTNAAGALVGVLLNLAHRGLQVALSGFDVFSKLHPGCAQLKGCRTHYGGVGHGEAPVLGGLRGTPLLEWPASTADASIRP